MKERPVYVTQPDLPPLEEFIPYLEEIWESKILTNGGPLHQRLEQSLCDYLGVPHVCLFANATLALVIALEALEVTGEVITTPYSFVATAHSLLWHGNRPVFVDVEPDSLNIDPAKIEEAITDDTAAILAVHCYGQPCAVEAIRDIAAKHRLRVIHDAAHAFGVRDTGGSVLRHGDLSVLSFHATKVFSTFEGGAIVCHDARMKQRIDQLKNFGILDEVTVTARGLNAKLSEVHAAFGLLQLRHMAHALQRRAEVDARYRHELAGTKGIRCLGQKGQTTPNYAYFPILVGPEYPLGRDALYEKLKAAGVMARRYFYPLISDVAPYRALHSASRATLRVAANAAGTVLCLPMYPALTVEDQHRVLSVIKDV